MNAIWTVKTMSSYWVYPCKWMVEINPIASFAPKKTKHPPPDTRLGIEPRKHKESKIISVQDILRTDGNRSSSPISYKKKNYTNVNVV